MSSTHGSIDPSNPGLITRFVGGSVGFVGPREIVGKGVIGARVTGLLVGDSVGSSEMMQGGSESIHITPLSRILPVQQLSPPPGLLPHPLPPQVPHASLQHISLLKIECGHDPGDIGVDVCGINVGVDDGDRDGLVEGEVLRLWCRKRVS